MGVIKIARFTEYDEDANYVLIAKEKHGTRYMDASTKDAFLANALKLMKERIGHGWYYELEPGEGPKVPELTQDQVDALPDGEIKDTAKAQWKRYRRQLRDRAEDDNFAVKVRKALADEDGELAWDVLRTRSDAEYEYVSLECLETP